MNQQGAKLRAMIAQDQLVVAPGAPDCIVARLIETAGFPAVYMTGGGTAGMLGFPDIGLVTMTEQVDNASRIANVVDVPVIADADTGYGNELNTIRAVREFEQRGVAAIHIEDQVFPKKCGQLANKEIVPREEYLSKIRAAVATKRHKDTIIIARTDAIAVAGFDEAVARLNLALAAGADVAFVEAPETVERTAQAPKLIKGPCLLLVSSGPKTPVTDLNEIQAMGYKIAILPGVPMRGMMGAGAEILKELAATRRWPKVPHEMPLLESFKLYRSEQWDAWSREFAPEKPAD